MAVKYSAISKAITMVLGWSSGSALINRNKVWLIACRNSMFSPALLKSFRLSVLYLSIISKELGNI